MNVLDAPGWHPTLDGPRALIVHVVVCVVCLVLVSFILRSMPVFAYVAGFGGVPAVAVVVVADSYAHVLWSCLPALDVAAVGIVLVILPVVRIIIVAWWPRTHPRSN